MVRAGAAVAWLALAACRPAAPAPRPAAETGPRLALEHVDSSQFEGVRRTRRLTAAQLLLVPKRLGFLEIAGLSELVLLSPRFEVALDEGAHSPDAAPRDLFDVALVRGGGVPSALMFDLECVLTRAGRPLTRISAARASANLRTGNVSLRDFRMTRVGSPHALRAARAEWSARARRFVIRGEYQLEGDPPARARRLEVDVELGEVEREP